jgi:two-component system sensor histidine kinase HydH
LGDDIIVTQREIDMKGLSRDIRIIAIGFAGLFLALAVLAGFFVAGESRKARILFEYEADRIAAGLLDGFRQTGAASVASLDTRILAFGIYRPTGEKIIGYGTVPDTLAPDEAARAFRYDSAGATLALVRPISAVGPGAFEPGAGAPGAGAMGMMRGGMGAGGPADGGSGQGNRFPGMMGAGRGGTLYLLLDARAFSGARRLYGLATVLAPVAVAGIAAAFLALLASNIRYRRRAEERETLARLGESARTLAHEIRNPLGAIRMQTELLRRAAGPARELAIIDEEVERLNLLSRRVADFLRSPAGTPGRVALDEHLRDFARRSPWPLRVPPDIPHASVWFDSALLRSVVENLARNAWESYGDRAGERPIELGLLREDGRVVLTVSDRGAGIPDGAEEKVFDPFFTDKIHGSGIGLPLSRRFVEAAGGTLVLRRRDGGGTEARVTLPLKEDA